MSVRVFEFAATSFQISLPKANRWQCVFCLDKNHLAGRMEHQYGGMLRCTTCGRWVHVKDAFPVPAETS